MPTYKLAAREGDTHRPSTVVRIGAIAAGADGIMVEVHPDPASALSDREQSLRPEQFLDLVARIRRFAEAAGRSMPAASSRGSRLLHARKLAAAV